MSTLFGKIFRSIPARAETEVYAALSQSAESPSASGTGGEDIRLDRAEDMDMVRAFVAILMDEPDTARETVRDMSPRDRTLLSFTLGELSRLVSEEDDFRRMADRRRARVSFEDTENGVPLDEIVQGHLRDI